MSDFNDNQFDFVASYGVLHHTENCSHGLEEHFRITKSNGGVFFVYLYNQGGIYWEIYDLAKSLLNGISPSEIRNYLTDIGVREGMIYTFIDNLTAPRVYYSRSKLFKDINSDSNNYQWRLAKGKSFIDDTEMLLSSKYGPLIYGPEGEIRIVITKN